MKQVQAETELDPCLCMQDSHADTCIEVSSQQPGRYSVLLPPHRPAGGPLNVWSSKVYLSLLEWWRGGGAVVDDAKKSSRR